MLWRIAPFPPPLPSGARAGTSLFRSLIGIQAPPPAPWVQKSDLAVRSQDPAAAKTGDPLQCVTGETALKLDPCADAYCLLGICHLSKGERDQAIATSERAIELALNHAENFAVSAKAEVT